MHVIYRYIYIVNSDSGQSRGKRPEKRPQSYTVYTVRL